MHSKRIGIVGGGAAGFFAALACAEAESGAEIFIFEKTSQFLSKVKISGGGRCNVTHACFDEREFAARFPRGERALIGPFKQFQASNTVAWYAAHGVKLKTEGDGRMFPVTDSSQTIMDCLLGAARRADVKLITNCGVENVTRKPDGRFEMTLARNVSPAPPPPEERAVAGRSLRSNPLAPPRRGAGEEFAKEGIICDKILLATGGCRTPALGQLAVSLGHTLEPPVPSLFTFHIETPWLRELAGVSVEMAEVSVPETKLRERGALLVTHWGLSGPAILRLSAWGARQLHELNYSFPLQVNWLPPLNAEKLAGEFQSRRNSQSAKMIVNSPIPSLPARLWAQLVQASGISRTTRWSALSRAAQHKLVDQLRRTEFTVSGKSLNKDEFVTCGGVRLSEVNFSTMESRICPGLFFAGEVLDIDGLTGGFNFQAAWTTGWIAGRAMAGKGARGTGRDEVSSPVVSGSISSAGS
ncbi:MAG TPA: NAD(P)/FAD-dependent oxidoreductase [Verrucomicrobiae bacterium]|nr:NAD(P)/FAD-dependent oxidoreductase [Verrucomicrobiae bacterium]